MELTKFREQIDRLDTEILQLLTRRMEYAVRTRRFKTGVTDGGREDIIRSRARERARGLLTPEFAEALFDRILEESRGAQSRPLQLTAFQGEHGSTSEVAIGSFSTETIGIPCRDVSEIFDAVMNGSVDFGIVPFESSLDGAEAEVHSLLLESNLSIVGEIRVPTRHSLLTLRGTDHREIKDVYSTTSILSQCRGFLLRNKLQGRPFYDSAGAALMLLRDRPTAGAVIADPACAALYNLEILKDNVGDHDAQETRYIVLSRSEAPAGGEKCSVVFVTHHQAGALLEVLAVFSQSGINLTRIESRPRRGRPSEVAFFLDFAGSEKDASVSAALERVRGMTKEFRLLGCYRDLPFQERGERGAQD
ncbi:MAG: chorismate mutase [Deltaproteobacteria bacterium]|nr:chorismate mutase [Deltaproteobacteria bacterium]